jgi:hypothetical protein
LSGDANLDGTVDPTDLNRVGLSWLSQVAAWSAGDFSADGVVDAADLNGLGIHWRQSVPLAASGNAVPEPSTWGMLIVACFLAYGLKKNMAM